MTRERGEEQLGVTDWEEAGGGGIEARHGRNIVSDGRNKLNWRCRHTAAETENLDVVPRLLPRQCQDRRREEHGLVVGVRDQEADAFVA